MGGFDLEAPTTFVTGPQGVPKGGSNTFTVSYSGLGGTIYLNLSAAQGATGSATFPNGANATQLTFGAGQNLQQTVVVQGVQASTNANDATLTATDEYGANQDSQQFSVVWVTISLQASNPPIQQDAELVNFQALVGPAGAQGGLGAEIFYNGQPGPYECSVGVELAGAVTPSNYPGMVTLRRNIIGSAVFDGQSPDTTGLAKPPGPDNSTGGLVDNVVGSGGAGQVFDLDPPGVNVVSASGVPERFRTNFQEYAVLGDYGDTSVPQSSAFFPFAVAVSCGGTFYAPVLDTTYLANGDNIASPGTINLTYNLKPAGQ
jgi:hypothetical protein